MSQPGNFERVNQLDDATSVFEFLDVTERLPFTRACKERMRALAPLHPGQHVLDVGCGLGHEIVRLGAAVGATGRVVGLDASADAIAEARRRVAGRPAEPEFVHASAERLPFDDANFDLARAERVAEYLESPQTMLAEMHRVLRSGGRMVVFDFDYSGSIVDVPDRDLAERTQRAIAAAVPSPWIGGQLRGLFVGLRLRDIEVVPMTFLLPFELYRALAATALDEAVIAGSFERKEVDAWWRSLERAQREDRFFASLTGLIVCGTK